MGKERASPMLRACLERVRHEDQGVVVLAKSFFGAFGGACPAKLRGQISQKRRRQSLPRSIAGFINP